MELIHPKVVLSKYDIEAAVLTYVVARHPNTKPVFEFANSFDEAKVTVILEPIPSSNGYVRKV